MTIRNLDFMFKPRSVAVIGASKRARSVGQVLSKNLYNAGFDGPVMAVNPKATAIEATLAYNTVADLPIVPDLAVLCTPPETIPGLIAELGARGTRAAVVITAGFGEAGNEETKAKGHALMQDMLDAARPHLMRIVGPNCVGVMVPEIGLNASFVHLNPLPGSIALVTQSGAVATSIVDWATNRNIGFSKIISLGDMSDVDFGDCLDYLARDPHTKSILLYVESVTDARKFMSAGRYAARTKPVIVIKSGRNEAAARAAASHTGALAGSDAVYDAAFRRAGMLRVFSLVELFDAAETLDTGIRVSGDRLAILTNGGGIGVLAAEALGDEGGTIADLSPDTMTALDACLPATWSHGNPVDIIGDATGQRYTDALDALLKDRGNDAILVLNCPTAVADSVEAAEAVVHRLTQEKRRPPVLTSWLGEGAAREARKLFSDHKIPTYETPGQAARAFMHLVHYKKNQSLLMETPPSILVDAKIDREGADAIIAAVLAEGRDTLTEPEAKNLLAAYGIPVVQTQSVATPEEAGAAAEAMGGLVALKILSPDITHKSDMGGVRLGLQGREDVEEAARRMNAIIAKAAPSATLTGFTVQQMADMPGALELIVGVNDDVTFGPTILFGKGGTEVEVVKDSAIALPPINPVLAREMMSRTRVWDLMQGYRNVPRADIEGVQRTLVLISQLISDHPQIRELDINPLLASDKGVLALDARVMVKAVEQTEGRARFAIRPYPSRLEKEIEIRDGRKFLMRPMRPEDEPLLQEMLHRSDPQDIRLRFFTPIRELTHEAAARLTQIDYGREMALAAIGPDDPAISEPGTHNRALYGVVRISADPDNEAAEYGVMVRSDMKGQALGRRLMEEIIDYAKAQGIKRIFGEVLRENTGMLELCEKLGFQRRAHPDDPALVDVSMTLVAESAAAE